MKVILMRHGEAFGYQDSDKTRQLTPIGFEQAQITSQYIINKHKPDMLVSSPYDRAVQTLSVFAQPLPNVPIEVLDFITPSDDANAAIKKLDCFLDKILEQQQVECLLVVCHMPIVADMVSILLDEWVSSYALAEARVIETDVLFSGLGTQIDCFVPSS